MPHSPHNISEENLIKKLKSREGDGMNILYDKYSAALFGIILRIVRSEEEAKNVLQETFVKIWRNFASYDPQKGRLFTWICNIARNHAIDLTRSRTYQVFHHSKVEESHLDDSASHSTLMDVEHIGVREEVEKLEGKYREVIELLFFQGYTQTEVADELEIPLGTVKSRVRIAFRELRKSLHET